MLVAEAEDFGPFLEYADLVLGAGFGCDIFEASDSDVGIFLGVSVVDIVCSGRLVFVTALGLTGELVVLRCREYGEGGCGRGLFEAVGWLRGHDLAAEGSGGGN